MFLALDLPPETKEQLFSLREHFDDLPARWVAKENIHLTLFFLGRQPLYKIELLKKALEQKERAEEVIIRGESLELGPPGNKKRLLWVKVDREENLARLYDIVRELLKNLSFPVEKREFLPHITLARLPSFWHREFPPENLPVFEDIFEPFEVKVKELKLFESKLRPQGPVYRELFCVGV